MSLWSSASNSSNSSSASSSYRDQHCSSLKRHFEATESPQTPKKLFRYSGAAQAMLEVSPVKQEEEIEAELEHIQKPKNKTNRSLKKRLFPEPEPHNGPRNPSPQEEIRKHQGCPLVFRF